MTPQGGKNSGRPADANDSGPRRVGSKAAPDASGRHSDSSPGEPLWNNALTMAGMFLAIISVLGLLTFGVFTLVAPPANPYVDILGYLVMPGILVIGLILMPLGVVIRGWRLHRRAPEREPIFRFPRVDLKDPAQRRAAKFVAAGTFVFLPLVTVSSYHGYHYTDSVEFCSETCHSVMKPEAVTYALSDHARVSCAECHIGAGASWFVKSKLSGVRQVIAVLRDSYSRPIPPAIRHLRPARETCEECHWPDKFFGAQLANLTRFASDEQNTRHEIRMLLKTGGGGRATGRPEGIHMHVALAGRIEYVAIDDRLQEIALVKLTGDEGNEIIYRSDGKAHSDPKPAGQTRHMDCMDCHNRPSHRFLAPAKAVDNGLRDGAIDSTLAFIKREAVAALVRSYPDAESAVAGIDAALTEFYRDNYPDVWKTREAAVHQAVEAVAQIQQRTFFSGMNVDWRTYPNNIGHRIFPGCFRCHAGRHVDENGNRISHACSNCHTFLNPVEREGESPALLEGEFIHPLELEGPHAQLRCDLCHTGGVAPPATCVACHADQAAFRTGTLTGFESFGLPAEPMADDVGCQECHDLSQPTDVDTINELCLECHEDEEERFADMLPSWKREVDQLLADAAARADANDKRVLDALRQAGPLHNVEATRAIVRSLIKPATGGSK
jgi:hypothetical protein